MNKIKNKLRKNKKKLWALQRITNGKFAINVEVLFNWLMDAITLDVDVVMNFAMSVALIISIMKRLANLLCGMSKTFYKNKMKEQEILKSKLIDLLMFLKGKI